MTVAGCISACKAAGYSLAGTEYSSECCKLTSSWMSHLWKCFCANVPTDCDNNIQNGGAPASSGCNMLCSGNQSEICGGSSRLSLYSLDGVVPRGPTSTSSAATSTASTPAPTGFPTGWSAQGCWVDNNQKRILSFMAPDSQTLTPQSCALTCSNAGYTVSGTEYSTQCFCGMGISNGGVRATADTECSSTCAGDTTQICGGPDRLSIVSQGEPGVVLPPAPIGQVGSWTYQGCYNDNANGANQRTFPWQLIYAGTLTPEICLDKCASFGYAAAGLEYGQECYCESRPWSAILSLANIILTS